LNRVCLSRLPVQNFQNSKVWIVHRGLYMILVSPSVPTTKSLCMMPLNLINDFKFDVLQYMTQRCFNVMISGLWTDVLSSDMQESYIFCFEGPGRGTWHRTNARTPPPPRLLVCGLWSACEELWMVCLDGQKIY
jgi:hypothetical protein